MVSSETSTPAWDEKLLKDPHAVSDKRSRVQRMFAEIAPSYDLNNRLHSLWMDQWWRRKAVRLALITPRDQVVDVACGTGDLAVAFAKRLRAIRADGVPKKVIGVDFTFEMLPLARLKTQEHRYSFLDPPSPGIQFSISTTGPISDTTWINADATALPLADECCDVVSIAFGIRNVADPAAAIREFYRVLKPNGRLIILEFSLPTNPLLRTLYNFYFRKILPRTATWISGDKTGAYKYLPESVNTFIGRKQMMQLMLDAGFERVEQFPMTFGVCVCYRGFKADKESPAPNVAASTNDKWPMTSD